MVLDGVPLFSLLQGRMSWLSARQSVLATNVANADTPNYVARDIKGMDFQSMMGGQSFSTSLATTNPRHFEIRSTRGVGPFEEEDALEDGKPTGNVVSIEQELIKLSDTQIQYQTATNLYQKAVNMFRTALGRSG